MSYTVRADPVQMQPYRTVFRVGVADGDTIIRPPVDSSGTTTTPATTPVNVDGEVYADSGPPTAEILAKMEVGDVYINTDTGDVLRLDSK